MVQFSTQDRFGAQVEAYVHSHGSTFRQANGPILKENKSSIVNQKLDCKLVIGVRDTNLRQKANYIMLIAGGLSMVRANVIFGWKVNRKGIVKFEIGRNWKRIVKFEIATGFAFQKSACLLRN